MRSPSTGRVPRTDRAAMVLLDIEERFSIQEFIDCWSAGGVAF